MPINLSKGQKVSLTKENPSLSRIMVGLGWDGRERIPSRSERKVSD